MKYLDKQVEDFSDLSDEEREEMVESVVESLVRAKKLEKLTDEVYELTESGAMEVSKIVTEMFIETLNGGVDGKQYQVPNLQLALEEFAELLFEESHPAYFLIKQYCKKPASC